MSKEESDLRETYFNVALLAIYARLPANISCRTREEAKRIVIAYINAVFEERNKGFVDSGWWGNLERNMGSDNAHLCDEWEGIILDAIQEAIGPKKDENGKLWQSKCFSYDPYRSRRKWPRSNHFWGELKYKGDDGSTILIIIDPWRTGYPNVYDPNDPYYKKWRE